MFEDEERRVKLSLRQADILKALAADENLCKHGGVVPDVQKVTRYLSLPAEVRDGMSDSF